MAKRQYTYRNMCVKCREYISDHELFYSRGVCHHCGNASPGTIVETYKEVGYWTGHLWWTKWHPKQKEEKDDACR